MKTESLLTLAVVGVVACAAVFAVTQTIPESTNLFASMDTEYAVYLAKFGKSYGTKEEYQFRYQQFLKTKSDIAEQNSMNGNTYTLATNMFSDWTPAEYKRLLGYKASNRPKNYGIRNTNPNPVNGADIDWRNSGAVTPVKNQGQCGSCWAFSTTGGLEGSHVLDNSGASLISLSEQQLVDCSTQNNGCGGGSMDLAYLYTESTPLETESEYPYTAQDGQCQYAGDGVVGATGYTDVPADNSAALLQALQHGPVSIAVEADQPAFQSYGGGILNANCGTALDHGVLIVGHVTGAEPYWIVKNSWGAGWGPYGGYLYIADEAGQGVCGINMGPVWPTSD